MREDASGTVFAPAVRKEWRHPGTYSGHSCVYQDEASDLRQIPTLRVYQELDERTLAERCSAGDRQAENELYTRYAARIYTLCRRYARNPDEAKDLMQESLLRALDRISTYTFVGKGSLYAWLSRIAVNQALNHIRRSRWRPVSLDVIRPDRIPEPDEEQMQAIPQEKLLEWISCLPDARRSVFNLYCLDGYSHKEIAEMLGISEKGSAGMLAQARRQLKEQIINYLKEKER